MKIKRQKNTSLTFPWFSFIYSPTREEWPSPRWIFGGSGLRDGHLLLWRTCSRINNVAHDQTYLACWERPLFICGWCRVGSVQPAEADGKWNRWYRWWTEHGTLLLNCGCVFIFLSGMICGAIRSRESRANWALQERTLLVSLFKCLKWIFRSTLPYTLKAPTPPPASLKTMHQEEFLGVICL